MHNAGQHGRQPTPQAGPPSDPRLRNVPAVPADSTPTAIATTVTESAGICRDFIWGICTMGDQCIYRHDLEFEAMKETLKFCHDHQNRTGCTRPDCTYLHTSREEENLFLTVGQIPRVLVDRYAKMSYELLPQARPEPEPGPPLMYEYMPQPPPPPPPPPPPQAHAAPILPSPLQTHQHQLQATLMIGPMNGAIQGPMPCGMPSPMQGPMPCTMSGPMPCSMSGSMPCTLSGPMPCTMSGPMQGSMQGPLPCPAPMQGHIQVPLPGPMQHPMQGTMMGSSPMAQMSTPMQPPPPPPPPTTAVSSSRMSGPVYTGGLGEMSSNLVSMHYQPATNQQLLPAVYDPSRPPPPFQKSSILKRPAEDSEAGPSKLRKSETSHESSCDKCVQRLIRIEHFDQEIDILKKDYEIDRKELKNRLANFEEKKRIVQAMLNPRLHHSAELYIEHGPTKAASSLSINTALGEVLTNYFKLKPKSTTSSTSSAPVTPSIISLLSALTRECDAERPPKISDESLLQQLATRLRPTTSSNGSTELLNSILGSMMQRSQADTMSSENRSITGSMGNSARCYSEAVPSPVRPYDGVGPSSSRPYEGTGPSPSRPYENAGPSPARPYEGAGPSLIRPYDAAQPLPSRPYDTGVPTMAYTEMTQYEPVRYPPPVSATSVNGQYHPGMELSAIGQGPRPVPAPTVQFSGPGPVPAPTVQFPGPGPAPAPTVQFPGPGSYGSPQPQGQAQGLPSRPPFYVQMPTYNGTNPPYPGMMAQAGHTPMQPPQNPQNDIFFGTRYPNYYPPYQ